MATFEVDVGDATYEVDAPDERTAWAWANQAHANPPATQMPATQMPAKIGAAGFEDALRGEMQALSWPGRQLVGAGTALSNLLEGAKQFGGMHDQQRVEANRILAGEAPVGAVAGNVGLYGLPGIAPIANTLKGAAITGAAIGALQPSEGGTMADIARSKLVNAGIGAGAGVVGQQVGQRIAGKIADMLARTQARKAGNAVRDATLREAQSAGYVVPPSYTDASLKARLLEGISGKFKTEQLARTRNQGVTNRLARRALGLAGDEPLTPQVLQQARTDAFNTGYVPVRSAGIVLPDQQFTRALDDIVNTYRGASRSFPGAARNDVQQFVEGLRVDRFDAGDAIDMVRLLRDDASSAFATGNNALGKAQRKAADAIESQIERHLENQGQDGASLLDAFRKARQQIAKTHSVERALVEGSGDINALSLANELKRGKPLSGELKTIARSGQAFKKAMSVPDVGNANPLTILDFGYTGGLAGMGAASGGFNPLFAAVFPAARLGARYGLLSGPGQRMLAQPAYGTRTARLLGSAAPFLPAGTAISALEAFR